MDFSTTLTGIISKIAEWEPILLSLSNETISHRQNIQNRTIKQILGHLIDSASNNHQRMVRLQYNPNLIFPDYRQDNDLWITLQDYQHSNWFELVQLWKYFNLHIVQLIKAVDTSKLNNFWTDFEGTKVTLQDMIEGYLCHLELHLNEIQELINAPQLTQNE
jgi:hypothetical protein